MTVPSGVSKIRLIGQVGWSDVHSGTLREVKFYKNGAVFDTSGAIPDIQRIADGNTADGFDVIISPAVSCVATDYFELVAYHTVSASISAFGARTWFEMQILS